MHSNQSRRTAAVFFLLFILLAFALSSCMSMSAEAGSAQMNPEERSDLEENQTTGEVVDSLKLEVGVEPTPIPTRQVYTNQEFGYQFDYPETWRVSEIDQGVEVLKDSVRLTIQAWWSNDLNPPVRWYGMPAGDLLYRDKQTFLGEIIPVYYLVYEGTTKQVLYNEGEAITSGDLQILIYLDSLEVDYESVDIPIEVTDEAKSILESFQRTGSTTPSQVQNEGMCALDNGDPPSDWTKYQNQDYGFYLHHPQDVEVVEGDHVLELIQGDLTLRIEYRRLEEAYPLPGIIPEGEVELSRFVQYFNEENPNPIVVERSEGRITRVSVGNVITQTTPVQFLVSVTNQAGNEVDLEQANRLLEIVETLCLNF